MEEVHTSENTVIDLSLNKQENQSVKDKEENKQPTNEKTRKKEQANISAQFSQDLNGTICSKCGYWRLHEYIQGDHRSCLCSLFIDRSICCIDGYKNLMFNVPGLVFWSPLPIKFIFEDILQLNAQHSRIQRPILCVQQFNKIVLDIKSEVIRVLPHLVNTTYSIPIFYNNNG